MLNYWASIPLFAAALSRLFVGSSRYSRYSRGGRNHHRDGRRRIARPAAAVAFLLTYGIPAVWLLWKLGQPTAICTAVLRHPLTWLLSQWPTLLTDRCWRLLREHEHHLTTANNKGSSSSSSSSIIVAVDFLVKGGPLGKGCSKILEVVAACLLWKAARGNLPETVVAAFDMTALITPRQSASTTDYMYNAATCGDECNSIHCTEWGAF